MKLYKNEIEVVERDDMTYGVFNHTGKYFAEVHYRPEGRRWETVTIGNKNGYKTKRGAISAIKREASRPRRFAPNGFTLIGI